MLTAIVFGLVASSAFVHVPPGSIPEGKSARVTGRMAHDAHVSLFFRHVTATQALAYYRANDPQRTEGGEFEFILPPEAATPPGLEYYITVDEAPVFATSEHPYFVTVVSPPDSIL